MFLISRRKESVFSHHHFPPSHIHTKKRIPPVRGPMDFWGKLFQYQNTYAIAMKPFGLQRAVVGSTARHKPNGQY